MSALPLTHVLLVSAAVIKTGAGCAKATYHGLAWLSGSAVRALERIKQQLADASQLPVHSMEATERFQGDCARAEALAKESPILRTHASAIARVMALQTSGLGRFLGNAERQQLVQEPPSKRKIWALHKRAMERFETAQADSLKQILGHVACEVGFTNRQIKAGQLTYLDAQGRELVTQVKPGKRGPQLALSFNGMSHGACHPLMNIIIEKLRERGVTLGDYKRISSWGELLNDLCELRQQSRPTPTDRSKKKPARGAKRKQVLLS